MLILYKTRKKLKFIYFREERKKNLIQNIIKYKEFSFFLLQNQYEKIENENMFENC